MQENRGEMVEGSERAREQDTEEEEGKTVVALRGLIFIRPIQKSEAQVTNQFFFFFQEMIESVKILSICAGAQVRYEN